MNKALPTICLTVLLAACAAQPISDDDKLGLKEGRKALLETNNRQLSDFLYIIPFFIDLMGGQPNHINIESIDGNMLNSDWKRVNYSVPLEPGKHVIEATCAVDIDEINRDVNDRNNEDVKYAAQFIEYGFEGGKTYRIHARDYINGTCGMYIKPE